MNIYLLSGLGGDERVFKNLRFPEGYSTHFIAWEKPGSDETLPGYCQRLSEKINADKPFILCGVSFGGVCAQEISGFLSPEKMILISTMVSPSEIPGYLRVMAKVKWERIISSEVYKWMARRAARIVGLSKKEDIADFQSMVDQFDPFYYKWSVKMINSWKGARKIDVSCLRLHGDRDKVFPVSGIKNAKIIEGGEHIMVMLQPEVISDKISRFLKG